MYFFMYEAFLMRTGFLSHANKVFVWFFARLLTYTRMSDDGLANEPKLVT